MQDASLPRAILMDHMDWFNPVEDSVPMPSLDAARNEEDKSVADLDREVVELARVICKGGAVFWRSAAKHPWYSQRFEKAGFRVAPIPSVRRASPSIMSTCTHHSTRLCGCRRYRPKLQRALASLIPFRMLRVMDQSPRSCLLYTSPSPRDRG